MTQNASTDTNKNIFVGAFNYDFWECIQLEFEKIFFFFCDKKIEIFNEDFNVIIKMILEVFKDHLDFLTKK